VVWIVWREDNQARQIYMDVPHSANVKPSWYGESVGHYEGDTLVIDTIGLSTKTVVDVYRTPHSEKLHVVERWRMIDGGKMMQVVFTVDDPDSFNEPWSGMRRYRRVEQEACEKICAENNTNILGLSHTGGGIRTIARVLAINHADFSRPEHPPCTDDGSRPSATRPSRDRCEHLATAS
jgi:hypothetical protein